MTQQVYHDIDGGANDGDFLNKLSRIFSKSGDDGHKFWRN